MLPNGSVCAAMIENAKETVIDAEETVTAVVVALLLLARSMPTKLIAVALPLNVSVSTATQASAGCPHHPVNVQERAMTATREMQAIREEKDKSVSPSTIAKEENAKPNVRGRTLVVPTHAQRPANLTTAMVETALSPRALQVEITATRDLQHLAMAMAMQRDRPSALVSVSNTLPATVVLLLPLSRPQGTMKSHYSPAVKRARLKRSRDPSWMTLTGVDWNSKSIACGTLTFLKG
jgi:hypothetical protein